MRGHIGIKQILNLSSGPRRIFGSFFAKQEGAALFSGSEAYWEQRYADGGNSGVGSYSSFARFKADVINRFVSTHHVKSVLEFGCGDGNQLRLAIYPKYLGFDVSRTAVSMCQELFKSDGTKSFGMMSEYRGETANLALSLDVIYHLVEDNIFENYLRLLFAASNRYVIIYSSDTDDNRGQKGRHVRHRKFTDWIGANSPTWTLAEHLPNQYPYEGDYRTGSFAEFFIYEKG